MNRDFLRFVLVGGTGFTVDVGLTIAIAHLRTSYIYARIPAVGVAMLVTWFLNRRFTFGVESKKSLPEVIRYATVSLLSALLNFLL